MIDKKRDGDRQTERETQRHEAKQKDRETVRNRDSMERQGWVCI